MNSTRCRTAALAIALAWLLHPAVARAQSCWAYMTPTTLPNGQVGTWYSAQVTGNGGSPPYVFSFSAGTLPPGLAVYSSGSITGTPTTSGTYSFSVMMVDNYGCTKIQGYQVQIAPPACPFTVSPASLPNGTRGAFYFNSVWASGGVAPYAFSVVLGSLPPGITLWGGGLLTGAPTEVGSFWFLLGVTDAAGCYTLSANTIVVLGTADVITGMGHGLPDPNKVALARSSGTPLLEFDAYGAYKWGVNVARAQVDGVPGDEILTGIGPGADLGPHVRAFTNAGSAISKVSYFAYATLKYGVNVTAGNLDGDAYDEFVTGPGPGNIFGPHMRGWNFDNAQVSAITKVNFFAFSDLQTYGARVAAGDLDADAYDEIIAGRGPGPTHPAMVCTFNFDNSTVSYLPNGCFTAFATPGGGADVASGNVDWDAADEILVSPGPGPSNPAQFAAFDYAGGVSAISGFSVTAFSTMYGGRPAGGDISGDGRDDLVVGAGPDPAADSTVKAYVWTGSSLWNPLSYVAFPGYAYGVNPAVGDLGY
ncbi:MAG: putative Ig domain-containing protein [Acidobacteriota bacterium]